MTTLAPDPTELEIEASLCRDSLADFIRASWPIIEPGQPLVWGWALDALCEHLEAVTRGEIKRLAINVPPRHMKSLTTSVFWPAWEWLVDPTLRYLSVSHSASIAVRDATACRQLMQTQGTDLLPEDLAVFNDGEPATIIQQIGYQGLLKLLLPDGEEPWEFSGDQNLKSRYENTQRGLRIATGIAGGSTGEGGNRAIIDDPHKLEEADSDTKRKTAVDYVTKVVPSRVNNSQAAIVVIMQRVHEEDVTAAVIERGYTHLCLPEQYDPKHPFIWPDDPREEPGEILFPERFDQAAVAEHEEIGPYKYAGNYQQLPAPEEGGLFKAADWGTYQPGSKDLPRTWERVLTSWDLTFGDNDDPKASYCVGTVWGKDGAQAYLLGQIRARMSFDEQTAAIKALRLWAPRNEAGGIGHSVIERKANGKAAIEHLTGTDGVPGLLPIEPKGSKFQRAVSIQPYQVAGNILLPAGVIPCPPGYTPTTREEYVHEHKQFPNGSHDDQVDSTSQGIHELFNGAGNQAAGTKPLKPDPEPTVVRGGKRLKGKKYVDVDPAKLKNRRRRGSTGR